MEKDGELAKQKVENERKLANLTAEKDRMEFEKDEEIFKLQSEHQMRHERKGTAQEPLEIE